MSVAGVVGEVPFCDTRSVGEVQPTHEQAVRALRALAGSRCADAERHTDAVPDSPLIVRSWKLLLRGLVEIETGRLRHAEPDLLQAAALAFIEAVGVDDHAQAEASRVAAKALNRLGWVYRREERPEDAERTHLAAYQLRERYGSFEELWETACELGLDADVARRFDEAERWHREAVDFAVRCTEEPVLKLAVAWTSLATSLSEAARHEGAVAAARSACEAWRRHDPAAVTAAQAEMRLGGALLKHGESLADANAVKAMPILNESVEVLTSVRDALAAFGPSHETEAAWCGEQLDFAARLVASSGECCRGPRTALG